MRRLVTLAAVSLLMVAVAVGTVGAAGNLWRPPAHPSIGINNVYDIGNAFGSEPTDNTILRLWMETGSSSEKCLVTIGEANHSPDVSSIYCSSRSVPLTDGRNHWGVLVTLHLDGPLADVDGDPSWYSLNVYQEGARYYKAPIRYEGD